MKLRYVFLLVLVFIISCGGGGGSNGSSVPSISSLTLSPNEANLNYNGGQTQIEFSFHFVDNGGDLSFFTLTVYDALNNNLGSTNGQIQGASGITSGVLQGTLNINTGTAAVYTFEFSLTDGAGSHSNKLTAEFTIVEPVSIAVTPINTIVAKGITKQFAATGTFPNSGTTDLTALVTWSSLYTDKATIDSAGLATGAGAGLTTITAMLGSLSGSTSLKVVLSFAAGVKYTSSSNTLTDTVIGDLNGDGRKDVAALANGGLILVYYQNSAGSFESAQIVTTGLSLQGIVIADVNNDGFADLIVSGTYHDYAPGSEGRIYVFLQDPATHLLGSSQQYVLSSKRVGPLAVADLNSDGLPDIVAAGIDADSNGVLSFLFQSAGGVLGPEVTYTNVPVYIYGELHVADMNNDGRNDIVLQSAALQLAVIKQVTSGVFSSSPDFYTVQTGYWSNFSSFALGDLNGDGRTDVAVADLTYNLNIFYQNVSGTLTGPVILSNNSADEVDIADLDGDGLNDIIMFHAGDTTVKIMYQIDDHTFPNIITYDLPTTGSGGTIVHQALSVGDVTGDGLPDIVASWYDEGIFVLPRLP